MWRPKVSQLPKKTRALLLITVNLEARSFLLIKSMNSESHGYFDRGILLRIKKENDNFLSPFKSSLEKVIYYSHPSGRSKDQGNQPGGHTKNSL